MVNQKDFLVMSGVEYSYPSARGAPSPPVLVDLNVRIADGEFICILGPSGCGKTSLLNLVAGFQMPTRGQILLDGAPIQGPGADRGVVFQGDDALFPWLNGRDNVAFGLKMRGVPPAEREKLANQYLALVHLKDHADKHPSELSGGMKQRIQIARVLANAPKVLLMDEPFGALDAQTRGKLQDELVDIWTQTRKTILFITHDIAEAVMLSDRIILLSKGPRSHVAHIVDVDIERPRRRGDPRFGQVWENISQLIEGEEVVA